jgi:hypothetical protein
MSYNLKFLKDKNVCYCKFHVGLDLLNLGLNFLRDPKKGMARHDVIECKQDILYLLVTFLCTLLSKKNVFKTSNLSLAFQIKWNL